MLKRSDCSPFLSGRCLAGTGGLLATIAIAIAACSDSDSSGGSPATREGVARSVPEVLVPGSFTITVKPSDAATTAVQELATRTATSFGCKSLPVTSVDLFGVDRAAATTSVTYRVGFEGCDTSRNGAIAILDKLAEGTDVLGVGAEGLAELSELVENDPQKAGQTHLPFIRRDEACGAAKKNGPRVVVAVVDTGVETEHPDLKDVLLRDGSGAVVGANFLDDAGQDLPASSPPDARFTDVDGHGSHVAGLVAAASNNGVGGVGVAACSNTVIMPIRVCGKAGCPSVAIQRGVAWAVQNGADVINLSLGGWYDVWGSSALTDPTIEAARARNVLVVAAAGNSGRRFGVVNGRFTTWTFPAAYEHVVSVAASNVAGPLADFSNRGPRVRVAAPGVDLLSTTGGTYLRKSGTSMASPVVAGAYALGLGVLRAGASADPTGRVDVERGQSLVIASILGTDRLAKDDVEAAGVLDAKQLVDAMGQAGLTATPDAGTPEAGPPVVEGTIWTSRGDILGDQLGEPMIDPLRPSETPRGVAITFAGTELFLAARVRTSIPSVKLFARRFDGTTWKRAGGPLTAAFQTPPANAVVDCPTFARSKLATPIMGFFVGSGFFSASACQYAVRQYNAQTDTWDAVGPEDGLLTSTEGICPFQAQTFCDGRSAIAVDNQGRPVVTFRTILNGAIVKRLEGGVWKALGPGEGGIAGAPGYTGFIPKPLALAIGTDGQPVLATTADDESLVVRRFDGASWAGVGPNNGRAAVRPSSVAFITMSLEVQPSGDLLAAGSSTPFSLLRFTGGAWGAAGFDEPTGLRQVRTLLDGTGNPLVAFAPTDASRKTVVVRQKDPGGPFTQLGTPFAVPITATAGALGLTSDSTGRVYMLFEQNLYRLE